MASDQDVITSDQLDLTKWGTKVAAFLGIIGPAAYAIFKDATGGKLQVVVVPAVAAIIVASLVSIAVIISADARARATATAAKLAADARVTSGANKNLSAAVTSLIQAPAALYASLGVGPVVPLNGLLEAKVLDEGDQAFLLMGVRRNLDTSKVEYLVARVGGALEWKAEDTILEVTQPASSTDD
jgi:hypothetical protein